MSLPQDVFAIFNKLGGLDTERSQNVWLKSCYQHPSPPSPAMHLLGQTMGAAANNVGLVKRGDFILEANGISKEESAVS